MRIAVTGAGGGVGKALLEALPGHHQVHPFSHGDLPVENHDMVMQRLVAAEPEVILHLAAATSVDGCETDPRRAFVVNALGTRNVALAAARTGALLVVLSTDYVFDGEKGEPYHEFDEPNPLSVYGRSKLAGEREARTLASDHLVIRVGYVYGAEGEYVRRQVARLAGGDGAGGIVDQWGTPTYVGHIGERLVPLALSGQRGTVHLAGPVEASWHDVLARAKELGGLPGEIAEQKAEDLGRPAPRPRNSALTSLVLDRTSVAPIPPLDDGVRALLQGIKA